MQPDLSMLPGRGSLVVACAECSKPFRIFPSFLTYRPQPTCSRACYSARQTRLAREANSRPCVVCGVMFYRSPGSFEKEGRKTCGLKCRAIWQTGRLLAAPDSPAIRFAQKVVKQDGCWGWSGGSFHEFGYAIFFNGTRNAGAHRFAWEQATGETLTEDDAICHVCDNPPCTRNDDEGVYEVGGILYPRHGHLYRATDAVNFEDMWRKGRARQGHAIGEQSPGAKLRERDVLAIRQALTLGADPKALAIQYSVTPTLIRAIRARRIWKHLEDPHAERTEVCPGSDRC